jgi:hypothetical protein
MRLNKPDGGFWRCVVGRAFKRFAPGIKLAPMVKGYGENGTLHAQTPQADLSGCDFINMLMIWFYAFAVRFAIRSEIFVIRITINLHVYFKFVIYHTFMNYPLFLLDFLKKNVLFIKTS